MRREIASISKHQPTREQHEFMERRLRPFVSLGVDRYSIGHLMREAYMQGLRDCYDALEHRWLTKSADKP